MRIDTNIISEPAVRGRVVADQLPCESTIADEQVTMENLAASQSRRARDPDVAVEMAAFARDQIGRQAGRARLAEANAAPRRILRLLE
jgi:flagellin-like hook-associated protein FlgL